MKPEEKPEEKEEVVKEQKEEVKPLVVGGYYARLDKKTYFAFFFNALFLIQVFGGFKNALKH